MTVTVLFYCDQECSVNKTSNVGTDTFGGFVQKHLSRERLTGKCRSGNKTVVHRTGADSLDAGNERLDLRIMAGDHHQCVITV